MADIGAKISIDGAKQFRDDLKNITQQGKTLSAQMGALAASFDTADNKEELLDKATKNLSEQIANQRKVVDKLAEAVAKSAAEKGEDATETLKLQEQLAKAETKLRKLEGTTAESALGMKTLAGEEKTVAKESDNASIKIGAMAVMLGSLAADAIKAGIKGIADAVKEIAQFFVDATNGAAEFADEVNTLSKTTGLSTDIIQEYQYAASLLDVDLNTITGSMTKLTSKMASAKDGTGSAADAFEKLGVSVTDENGNLRDANDVFNEAVTALGKIENETERDATAMEIFGKSAKDLNPLIEAGTEELAALRQESHDVGYVMSTDTLNSMSEVQDGFDRLGLAADSAKNQIGSAIGQFILPYMNSLVSAVQDLLKTGNVDEFIDNISGVINDLVSALMDALPVVLKAGAEIIGKLIMGINSMLPKLAPTVVELVSRFAMFIVKNLPIIINTALDIILALAKGLGEQLPQLIPAVIQMLVSIATGIVEHLPLVIDAALSIIEGLIEGLTSEDAINAIIDSIPTIITALINGIVNSFPRIIASGANIIVNLVYGLIKAIPKLIASIPQIIKGIVDTLKNYDWSGMGGEIMSNLGNGIAEKASYIWNTVKDAFNSAIQWIKNLGSQALTWGKDMIQGFINGIKEKAQALWDEVKSIGRGIADFLGFSVPKKGVLHYYEEWMPDFMMGLAKGIDENAWRVQDALKDATGGMTLSGKTTNVEMGGVSVNVYASPNQDTNAIADAVMRKMQGAVDARRAVFA
jgi:phage-related protein